MKHCKNQRRETLVLDKNWKMMKMISWKQAIVNVYFKENAVVHDQYDHVVWSSRDGSEKIRKPRIISLKNFVLDKVINKCSVKRLPERALLERDGYKCQYCGHKLTKETFTKDHVLPRSKGGLTTSGNLVCSCYDCNQTKGDRTPEEAGMLLLKPVKSVNMFDPTRKMMEIYNNFIKQGSAR